MFAGFHNKINFYSIWQKFRVNYTKPCSFFFYLTQTCYSCQTNIIIQCCHRAKWNKVRLNRTLFTAEYIFQHISNYYWHHTIGDFVFQSIVTPYLAFQSNIVYIIIPHLNIVFSTKPQDWVNSVKIDPSVQQ